MCLTPAHLVAVILGTPGSGKSTLLRWLALHMGRASLSQNYALPAGFAPAQVPLLIHLRDYAESFGKESLSMSVRGMQDLTQIEKETANRAGIEQRDRLLQILTTSPDLRQLAVNPLTLTQNNFFPKPPDCLLHHGSVSPLSR
jgi:energy-coupling factor transporter ATP-binding protein EcfA2